jgi:hypothetical protein
VEINDERIREAVERTEVIRAPKQNLYTFGTTNIHYFLVTEPVYTEVTRDTSETVIREGKVIAERPRIVTPYYLSSLEGFSDNARRYFDYLIKTYGRNTPGLFYSYRNEPKELNIVSNNLPSVVDKLKADIDQRGDPLTALIKGVDELWDVALIKFAFEMTSRSLGDNISQLGARGLLGMDKKGVPGEVRYRIDDLFHQVTKGERAPHELKEELDRWGLFEEYEDRFLSLFRK